LRAESSFAVSGTVVDTASLIESRVVVRHIRYSFLHCRSRRHHRTIYDIDTHQASFAVIVIVTYEHCSTIRIDYYHQVVRNPIRRRRASFAKTGIVLFNGPISDLDEDAHRFILCEVADRFTVVCEDTDRFYDVYEGAYHQTSISDNNNHRDKLRSS
jgi:hypothetical protein